MRSTLLKGSITSIIIGDHYRGLLMGGGRTQACMHSVWFLILDMGISQIRGTLLGVPIMKIVAFWGSMLGYPYSQKLPGLRELWGRCCYCMLWGKFVQVVVQAWQHGYGQVYVCLACVPMGFLAYRACFY